MFSDWNLVGLNISAINPKISVVADGRSIISLMSAKGRSKYARPSAFNNKTMTKTNKRFALVLVQYRQLFFIKYITFLL